jgi:hypothetical protein
MKINDIRKFVSTDRMVHVALSEGGSKDGYLRIVSRSTGTKTVTMVSVQGERGRPLLVHPSYVEDISWHPVVPDPQPVQPIRKSCAVCGKTGVTLTAVKAEPDGTRLLLCKDHKAEWEAKQEAAQSAKASRTAGKMVQAVLLVDARPTFKAIQKELTRLADKPQGVGPKDAALLEVALEALRRA